MTTAPVFIGVEQKEFLELTSKRGRLAYIRLGDHDGRWFFALGHQQFTGDHWGSGGPLGFTQGRPRRDFDTRDDALTAAIAHARDRWSGREREMAEHFAWLDTLIPEQPDLFAFEAPR